MFLVESFIFIFVKRFYGFETNCNIFHSCMSFRNKIIG